MRLHLGIFFLFAFAISFSLAWRQDQVRKFQRWKKDYSKNYQTPEDEEKAMSAMLTNSDEIEAHNERFKTGTETFSRGLWSHSDLSFEEKKKVLTGNKETPAISKREASPEPQKRSRQRPLKQAPTSVNWVEKGLVHEVEDQQECGSCYAFATVGTVEGVMLRKNVTTRLSVQQIVDCNLANFGCSGGDPTSSLKYAKSSGLVAASNYPYKNKREKCKASKFSPISKFSEVVRVPLGGNENRLKEIVANNGPVAVAINTASTFMNYMQGVYTNPKCSKTPDHAVLVVGYGVDENYGDYWLVKNSWGTSWGELGYVRMARNKNNLCGIANMVWYAT